MPVADLPDQRAWDAKTSLWSLGVGVEAELRPSDLQALELRLALKIRDGRVDRLILVIADTRRNRDLVRDVGGSMRASFPIQGRSAWAAISDPVDPGCNLLLFA